MILSSVYSLQKFGMSCRKCYRFLYWYGSNVRFHKLHSFYFVCRMRYVAAYLLAALGGKDNPNSADIEKILSSVGIEADTEKLKKVIGELNGKNIEELIAAGNHILECC